MPVRVDFYQQLFDLVATNSPISVVQVSSASVAGGAEKSAQNLHKYYMEQGLKSRMIVGRGATDDKDVVEMNNKASRNRWVRNVDKLLDKVDNSSSGFRGAGRLLRGFRRLAEPTRWIKTELGIEDFNYPATQSVMNQFGSVDIVHCHNLHGGYFDLRELPPLGQNSNLILNLRDAWMLTGHCALPMACERWKSGCGKCPDLDRYPSIRRDATALNWKRKQKIFDRARYYLVTPSKWMLDLAFDSMLMPGVIDTRVIPNGFDDTVFYPGDKAGCRRKLGLQKDQFYIMTAGRNICDNIWKNFPAMLESISILAREHPKLQATFLVIGSDRKEEQVGKINIKYIPFIIESQDLADYYRACDIYFHGARVESFGNVLMEAKACGTAVVSSAVGGIPEHVNSLSWLGLPDGIKGNNVTESHGILTRPGDSQSMAQALNMLLNDKPLTRNLGEKGAIDARENFTIALQGKRFISWYKTILADRIGSHG